MNRAPDELPRIPAPRRRWLSLTLLALLLALLWIFWVQPVGDDPTDWSIELRRDLQRRVPND